MNRRSLFKRLAALAVGAVIAPHVKVPPPLPPEPLTPLPWMYQLHTTSTTNIPYWVWSSPAETYWAGDSVQYTLRYEWL